MEGIEYKKRLFDYADLIEDAIVTIKAQAFSEESARNFQKIAHLIIRIYNNDKTIVRIMHKMIYALTGVIDAEKTSILSSLNSEFRNHIREI